jgi:hypothetical protein
MKTLSLTAVLVLALATTGCMGESESSPGPGSPMTSAHNGDSGLGELVYLAAQTAAERAGMLSKDRPIIVTTMVSVDDFKQSSTFGRLASQLISNRMSQRGYMVRDITYARILQIIPETGEVALSRDAARLIAAVNAQAVVTGTYAVAGEQIYLNVRILKPDDGQVISSADVTIPLNSDTRQLVAYAEPCTHQQEVDKRIAQMNGYTSGPNCS